MKTQTLTAKFIVVSTLFGLASGAMASSSKPSHCGPNTISDPNRPAICIVDPAFIKKVKAEAAAAVDTQEKYDKAFADGVASVDITQECTEIGVAFFQDTDAPDATFGDCTRLEIPTNNIIYDFDCVAETAGARLFGAYVKDAYWEGADLVGLDLSNVDLSSAELSSVDLSNVDLSSAELTYADLSSAELTYADLSDADLSNADLSDADLSNADLSDADLGNVDLKDIDLSDADLSGAYLSDADLSGADLSNADLSKSYIQRSDFTGANLSGANLEGAGLKLSDLDDVIWTGATCPDGENADDNGGTCENNL